MLVVSAVAVLVVDDNEVLAGSLAKGLREDGFEVDVAATGAVAIQRVERRDIEAIVLDLGLPDLDGLVVLERTRALGVHAPILVLTARDGVNARVAALDRGADDYVVKPFQYVELLARLRALVRRATGPRWSPLTCGSLVMRDDKLGVSIDGKDISLSPREHALLAFLLRRQGEVFSRKDLLLHVFGYEFEPGTNIINVHVSNLRRKVGTHAIVIEAIRGIGYRLRATEPRDAG